MQNDFLLLGIDGGATKVSGWEVLYDEHINSFTIGNQHAQKAYSDIPGYMPEFKPVELPIQLQERDAGAINPTAEEEQQAAVYVEACARVIESLVEQSGKDKILAGLGMPGLKTVDKRGIGVVANGPRMVNYSDLLEKRLALKEIKFISPIAHLGSDADYCGIGENYSTQGLFKNIKNGYYLGGGTGAADALKLNGHLFPFDEIKDWMAKCWEMKSEDGRSLERFASASGIQSVYADFSSIELADLNAKQLYPPQIAGLAAQGDKNAAETYRLIVKNLALLIYERITTLYAGWQDIFEFVNPAKPNLQGNHPFTGTLLEEIIIGQRLGDLLESKDGRVIIKTPLIEELSGLIQKSQVLDDAAKEHYSKTDKILVNSLLREAPALGAGIDAFFNYKTGLKLQ